MKSMNSSLPHYISIQKASDETGMSYYQLRELVLDGKLQHIKSGVKYLINEGSLIEYLKRLEQEEGAKDE